MSRYDLLSTYDYQLPDDFIAKEPLAERDASRLMVVDRQSGSIEHRRIRDLPALLYANDCLVLNNSRVLPARLFGVRTATGGKWEGLYLSSTSTGLWRLIGQTRGYLRLGETITLANDGGETLQLKLIEKEADGICQFEPLRCEGVLELLPRFGTVPLPPYMDRKQATANDWERYQTTYAQCPGSVAAPTAGLHFTPELLDACRQKGIGRAEVTLHVGIGTFRPVSVENLTEHRMHSEWCEVPQETADTLSAARSAHGRIVAVGTTSLRTLESAIPTAETSAVTPFQAWQGETNLFVRPPYRFRSTDILLTNFHLPKSTLLMLVAAFGGLDLILEAYRIAIAERYRFFSYGDAMLIV
ncbi:tRNA preQ1(34) S-adenosylmethionine ribosyltransferase-isomerase QueA [Schlesneria paludicola]|uniref:tRNA preQ1(34) S-adenosylmethionine ribosyltransferase-isomerase QueA n=1 Tax=Schlesneria paludicola TaxID=360056 RepID=UPI0002F45587|nr:tRNA preQ1(34) S-adenosylmethionine ribosyltransferase-isomerase QueA [Schlesneria paludicola]